MKTINNEQKTHPAGTIKWIGLAGGPLAAFVIAMIMPESYQSIDGETIVLGAAAKATAAVGIWMAVWWMTEAIPVYATALLPLALFPLTGATGIETAAAPYGDEIIFLFLGGFILAVGMERWGLHRRFAFAALSLVGTRPDFIVGGFMAITAFCSMWVTNTATTIMMLPIALSVVGMVAGDEESSERRNFALCLLLGIAYSASIGGIGTLIGTAPNILVAAFLKERLGIEISFAEWMKFGLPLVFVFVPFVWFVLTRLLFRLHVTAVEGSRDAIRQAYKNLGPMSRGEVVTLVVFSLTAFSWIFRRLLNKWDWLSGLTDPGIAVCAALALFLIPVDMKKRTFAMDWQTAVGIPWGLLILFGGGLSLAAAVDVNGVSAFLGSLATGLSGLSSVLIVASVITMMIFLTELTSNTATTATLIPITAAIAPALGLDPLMLVIPAGIAASCAFMLPVATPPNAIVFGSGLIRIPEMSRAGMWLNLAGILFILGLSYFVIAPILLG